MKKRILPFFVLIMTMQMMLCNISVNASRPEAITVDITPGEVITTTVSGVRLLTNVVGKIGNKKVLYGNGKDNNLYAYDVTDPTNVSQIGSAVAHNRCEAEMIIKGDYLIAASSGCIYVYDINDDGSIGTVRKSIQTGSTVTSMHLLDDYLFVGTSVWQNTGVWVYDLSDMDNISSLGVDSNAVRGIAVEKISDLRYRVYTLKAGTNTMTIGVVDVKKASNGKLSKIEQYASAAPVTTTELGWTTKNNGKVSLVAPRTLAVDGQDDNQYIVDVTAPTSPTVVRMEERNKNSYAYRQLKLDSTKTIEMIRYGNVSNVMDYSTAASPIKLGAALASGDGASVYENYLYLTSDGSIKIVKLYNEITLGELDINKSDANISVSLEVTNHIAQTATPVLISAIYKDDKMICMDFASGNIGSYAEGNISTDIDVSAFSGYTFKTWVFDNFGNMELLTNVHN